jgi:hypothetical protein
MNGLSAVRNVVVNVPAEGKPKPVNVKRKEKEGPQEMSRAGGCTPSPEGFGKKVDKAIEDTSTTLVMAAIKTIARMPSILLFK